MSEVTLPIVTLIQQVVSAMVVSGISSINFQPGRSLQIITSLIESDNSITHKAEKYPLIALLTPVQVARTEDGFYGRVRIPVITIAAYSSLTSPVLDRYANGGTFLAQLYPLYYEFLKQLSINEVVVNEDFGTFKHTLEEDPGVQDIPKTTDFVDCLNIKDLEFYIIQKINC